MAASGYTPISLYYSSTASATPTAGNLVNGELAINITDGKLYYKDNGGAVQLLASKAGASGDVVGPASATDNAVARFDLTTGKLIQNSGVIIDDSNNVSGVAQLNATTVDLTNLEVTNIKAKDGTASITLADSTGVATFSANPILNAGTANGVAYLNGSKVLTTGSALTFDGTNLNITSGTNQTLIKRKGIMFYNTGASDALIETADDVSTVTSLALNKTDLKFYSSGSEQMRLTSTGLGIGTSSPSYKLDVARSGNGVSARIGNGATATYFYNDGSQTYITGEASVLNGMYINSGSNFIGWLTGSGGAERMRLDSSGNLGLGVTPSAWGTSGNIQMPSDRAIAYSGVYGQTGTNIYYNAGWKYYGTGAATLYSQETGKHIWFTAPSGTAGNAISFTQAMTLDASGNLLVGNGASAFAKLSVLTSGAGNDALNVQSSDSVASIQMRSTTGTYIGTPQNVYMAFGTNNAERMRIDSSGNVGIGTSSPNVGGSNANNTVLTLKAKANAFSGIVEFQNPGTTGDGQTLGWMRFFDNTTENGAIEVLRASSSSTANMVFRTNGGSGDAERMRIDSNGNVGIGTSSPAYKLDVSGDVRVNTGAFRVKNTTGSSNLYNAQIQSSEYGYASYFPFDTGAAQTTYRIRAGYSPTGLAFQYSPSQTYGSDPTGQSYTTAMLLDSSGNLLVGTTTVPTGSTGGSCFEALSNARWALKLASTTTSSATLINFVNPNGSVGTVSTSGTATTYATSSDYRLKENIQPMQNALGVVAQLNPVTYTWKADGSDGQGFIAHELQAVVPDCVTGEKDAVDEEGKPVYQGIDTSFLVATLTKAIQELKAELDATKAEVAALKGN